MQDTPSQTESSSDESLDDCLQQMSSELNMDDFLKNIEQLGGQVARRNQNVIAESRKEQILKENLIKLKQKSSRFGQILESKRKKEQIEQANKVEFDTVGMRTEEIQDMKELTKSKDSKQVMQYLNRLNEDINRKIKQAKERPEPKMRKAEFNRFYDRVQMNADRSRSRLEEKRRKWKGYEDQEATFKPRLNRRDRNKSGYGMGWFMFLGIGVIFYLIESGVM
jgi:restriction endonuclease